jgi:hypothetical protein
MGKFTFAGMALCATFTSSERVNAYVNYPWCIAGDSRGMDCYFSTKEQCMQDGRNRGFGSQCRQNPYYDPKRGPIIESNPTAADQARRHPQGR